MSLSVGPGRIRLFLFLSAAIGSGFQPAVAQAPSRSADSLCTHFVARRASLLSGEGISTEVFNSGTVSGPRNDSTDLRWRGLGYGYEFGLFAAAEVPGKGRRGRALVKRDRFGRIQRDMNGDTLWVRHIVSEGLRSHGGERSPDGSGWWGWHAAECLPVESSTRCLPDTPADETFTMNDLLNREFDYYPLQGDSTWQGLGLHVRARFVQSADPALGDVLFLIHRIENRSRIDLDNLVVGMWGDPHVGGAHNYDDDLARFKPELDLVEVWDADGIADTPGVTPGYFGYQFLEGSEGMTSLTVTPFVRVTPSDDEQMWELVRPGRYDGMPRRPGDDVYVFGSGPTRLRVGESVQFAVALILGENAADLEAKAAAAREVYLDQCGLSKITRVEPKPARRPTSMDGPLPACPVECPLDTGCEPPFPWDLDTLSCDWMGGPDLDPYVTTPSRMREPLMDAPASVSVIKGEKFVRDPAPSVAATLRHTVGVDIAQVGADRYHVSTRGFNQAFAGDNLLLVDHRQGAVPGLGFNSYALLPATPIDVAQVEVVRGSESSLYGSRADHGVIQFLTKEPFEYPGTSFLATYGENELAQSAVRHAAVLSKRFAYKVVGSYSRARDQMFDNADEEGLSSSVESRAEHVSNGFARGTLQYRHVPCGCLTVTANVDYAGMRQNLLHDRGEMFADYRLGAGQLKVESDRLFAQLYYMKGDARDAYDYRTGLPIVDKSSLFAGQIRYRTDLFEGGQKLVVGFDYDRTNSDTGGELRIPSPLQLGIISAAQHLAKSSDVPGVDYPIHLGRDGRNEADDALDNAGIYLQSRTRLGEDFALILAGRADFDNVIDTQFSPSFGLAYRPSSSHAFRLSLNRGLARPTSIQLFADFPVANRFFPGGRSDIFPVRARGNLDGWTFSTPPRPTSLFQGHDLDVRDGAIGMDLQRAYLEATDRLFAPGAPLQGWEALQHLLEERAADIEGLSDGILRYESDPEAPAVDVPTAVSELKPMTTRSIEIGYKGNFRNRTFVGIDFFYAKTKNHLSRLRSVTPLVFVPNLPDDLVEEIYRVFTDEELAYYKISRKDLDYLYRSVIESFGRRPVGILEPEENFSVSRGPEQLLSWVNYGKADYFGIDFEFRRVENENLSYFANFSWLSDNYFDDAELDEAGTGFDLALNAPRFKASAGLDMTFAERLYVSLAGRYVDSFEARSGVHEGYVDDYFLLDAGLGVAMDELAPGLRLDVTAENLFDHEHSEWADVPPVGRQVTARLTYSIE